MRRVLGIASAAIACTAVVVGVNAAQAASDSDVLASTRFTVVEHADTDTVVDNRPAGDSLGDSLAFGNPVYNARNTAQVGHDQGSCVRTEVGVAWECSWTTILRGGSIVVQGPFYDATDSTLAITGGTGTWSEARGQMLLHARNKRGTEYDFTFVVER
jgi:hypothetical protein